MTEDEIALERLLMGHRETLTRQRRAFGIAKVSPCEIAVPDSFAVETVAGAMFISLPLVRANVAAPKVRKVRL
jgi:hypothetical protein